MHFLKKRKLLKSRVISLLRKHIRFFNNSDFPLISFYLFINFTFNSTFIRNLLMVPKCSL